MFFRFTWKAILDGRKTQTRIVEKSKNLKPGSTVAIQSEYRTESVGRIDITDVYKERLGDISMDDVRSEGFDGPSQFIEWWKKINRVYDPDIVVWVVKFRLDSVAPWLVEYLEIDILGEWAIPQGDRPRDGFGRPLPYRRSVLWDVDGV